MQKNAVVLTVICILLCLSFNYTFPLDRESSDSNYHNNNTPQHCNIPLHHANIVDRTKKMASNIESAFKRIKDSTQDFGKNIYDHVNVGLRNLEKNPLSEEDIRQYEQLVIMKKYPYLDLKELDLKYSPSNKNARQSIFEPSQSSNNFANEQRFHEPLDEGPNVEITNRGLSGFAIPPQLSRRVNIVENKQKTNNINSNDGKPEKNVKFSLARELSLLGSLKDDVREYVEKMNDKLE